MTLVQEWRRAWRWFSMQAMALVAALQGGWMAMPDDLRAHVPARWAAMLSLTILLLGLWGRLVRQPR